jgi:hypothetical protein
VFSGRSEKPVGASEKLVGPSEKPVGPSEKPVDPSEKLVGPSEKLVDPSEKLVGPSEKPVDPSEKLVDPSEKSVGGPSKQEDRLSRCESDISRQAQPVDPASLASGDDLRRLGRGGLPPGGRANASSGRTGIGREKWSGFEDRPLPFQGLEAWDIAVISWLRCGLPRGIFF